VTLDFGIMTKWDPYTFLSLYCKNVSLFINHVLKNSYDKFSQKCVFERWDIVVATNKRSKEDYGLLKKMISFLHI
jgi:hypothetical protein